MSWKLGCKKRFPDTEYGIQDTYVTCEINILCAVEITDGRYFQRMLNDMKCKFRELKIYPYLALMQYGS